MYALPCTRLFHFPDLLLPEDQLDTLRIACFSGERMALNEVQYGQYFVIL